MKLKFERMHAPFDVAENFDDDWNESPSPLWLALADALRFQFIASGEIAITLYGLSRIFFPISFGSGWLAFIGEIAFWLGVMIALDAISFVVALPIRAIMVNSEYGWERDDGKDDCEAIEKNNDTLEKAVSRRKKESAEKATRGKER